MAVSEKIKELISVGIKDINGRDIVPASDYLFKYADTSPFGLPDECGVYAVCSSKFTAISKKSTEKILYIGSSKSISKRVLNPKHPYRILFDRKKDDTIIYTKCILTNGYEALEKGLIAIYKPRFNKRDNPIL